LIYYIALKRKLDIVRMDTNKQFSSQITAGQLEGFGDGSSEDPSVPDVGRQGPAKENIVVSQDPYADGIEGLKSTLNINPTNNGLVFNAEV
jgi:hypothetical protein